MRLATLSLLVTLYGCATFHGASRSTDNGWHQVTTPNFVVRTDFDEKTAVQAAVRLESTRDALISAAWPAFDFSNAKRTEVYVLSDGLEFERLFGRRIAGLFTHGAQPAFFLYGSPDRWEKREVLQAEATSSLRHEMAHQLAAVVFAHEARWFAEGLAQFLETIHESEDHKSIVVGAFNLQALKKYRAYRNVTLRRMFEWSELPGTLSDTETMGLYGTSWFFVHWLLNTRPEPFAAYQVELARGTGAKRAWEIAFPNFDPDVAERELYEYARHGNYDEFPLPLKPTNPSVEQHLLPPADAHLARAHVILAAAAISSPPNRETRNAEAKSEIGRALELDPTNVDALEMDTGAPVAERIDRARRSTTAHPDNPKAFRILGDLLSTSPPNTDEREQACRRAVTLDPTDPTSLNALAWLLVEQHRATEALPLALRAVKRAPDNSAIIDTYAVALFQAGRCQTAITKEQRALELLRDASQDSTLSTDLRRHLSEFQAGCKEAPPAP